MELIRTEKLIKNLSTDECLRVLANNHVGRLGYIYANWPFVTPITYYHDAEEKCIISYSADGHKLYAMGMHGKVALQVDEIVSLNSWKSVLVQGEYEQLSGSAAKRNLHRFADGVKDCIARKGDETPKFIKDFSSRLRDRGVPLVYKISISDIIGKYRNDSK